MLDGAEKVNSAGLHFSSSFTLSLGKIATKAPASAAVDLTSVGTGIELGQW